MSQPGFAYSAALRNSGLTWTEACLNEWLANPSALVPGNIMVVQLANDPNDRGPHRVPEAGDEVTSGCA
jgi:cytochrome c